MTTAREVIDFAAKQVGTLEDPMGSNKTEYGRSYGLDGNPWCAMFVSHCFREKDLPLPASTAKGFAYTPAGAKWFKSRNRWHTTPKVGDVVFFKLPGGANRINHVGIVQSINPDGSITTIEGNTKNRVARRRRTGHVVGYGRPDYR